MTVHIAPAELDDEPRLIAEWRLLQTPPWRYIAPVEIGENEDWIAARAPGTVAAALEAAGRFDRDAPVDLDGFDHWYRAEVVADGTRRLVFHGLATLAEIFVDGAHVARSDSMFTPLAIEVAARGRLRIDIVFRAMGPKLAAKGPRARWRSRAVQPAAMRCVRSTLIGRMPGWCPPIRAVGPWRAVELRPSRARAPEVLSVRARLERATGVLELRLAAGPALTLRCAGAELRVAASDAPREVTLKAPGAAPWRPQTQGEPALHPVEAEIGGRIVRLGRVGFRSIALDRGADGRGFGLIVNGEPLFCRGANWISADIVSLNASRESLRAQLELAREAGFNMLRCPGSTVYESDDFYALCDELGLLVWQDFMFANLDYPRDEAFLAGARAEAEAFLTRTRWSPSLAVFCGGAEIAQQAAMLGLPEESWRHPLFDALLPDAVAVGRPGAIYVAHSPQGGDLPFSTDAGLCHYYGVTAHLRGFDDIRRSQVRFATECLGLAHPPADDPPLADEAAIAQPIHGERIAGDTGAIWHFEGVRNHYVAQLYGVDCAALRAADPARYLDLSRAATCEVATELFAEWRSAGSPTRGALTLFFQDVAAPGAGWGLIDHRGRPKPVWHALRRACQPIGLTMTDEGLNGYRLTLINETARPRAFDLDFACLREGATAVASATRRVELQPRSAQALTSAGLLGGFFDVNCAYRFGAPGHDVVTARLVDPDSGETVAQASAFPLGRGAARVGTGLAARLAWSGEGWFACVTTRRFAQNVYLRLPGYRAADDWFHLAPGETRRVRLRPLRGAGEAPRGWVSALNDREDHEVTT